MYFFNPAKIQHFPFPSTTFLQISQRSPKPPPHLPQDLAQGLREAEPHLVGDLFGITLSYASEMPLVMQASVSLSPPSETVRGTFETFMACLYNNRIAILAQASASARAW